MDVKMKGCPPIYCPHCNFRLLNAGDKSVKNGTTVQLIKQNNSGYEYIIRCGRCGSYVGIVNSAVK